MSFKSRICCLMTKPLLLSLHRYLIIPWPSCFCGIYNIKQRWNFLKWNYHAWLFIDILVILCYFYLFFFFGLGNCHLKWLEVALGSKRTMKYVISVAISSFVSQVFYVQGLFHHWIRQRQVYSTGELGTRSGDTEQLSHACQRSLN